MSLLQLPGGTVRAKVIEIYKVWISSRKAFLKFILPSESNIFNCHNLRAVKLLIRLSQCSISIPLENVWQGKVWVIFVSIDSNIVFIVHLTLPMAVAKILKLKFISLRHRSNYSNERSTFLNIIRNIDGKIFRERDFQDPETLLYDDN